MTEYRVEWSVYIEAEDKEDALNQAWAMLDDTINRRIGATCFIVESRDENEDAKSVYDMETDPPIELGVFNDYHG